MIDIQSTSNFLSYASSLTLIILFASLAIFGWLAIRYRHIKNFEFQIFVFIIIYIIGEILEEIPSLSTSLPHLGSQLHLIAAAFLAMILWIRLYYARSSGQRTVDKLEPVGEGDVENANENI